MKLPRFTLRELFLLVVIAAMGCGWWVDRSRIAGREQAVDDREQVASDLEAEAKAKLKSLNATMHALQPPPIKGKP